MGLRMVDPGNLVHATDTAGIVTITQDHPIAAIFTLPQEELPRVQAALAKGRTPVLAYSSDDSTALDTGSLLTPNNPIDTTTGTIKLKAEFPNPRNTLWPGQFINAHLQVGIDQQRGHGAADGGAARAGRALCLRREAGRNGGDAADQRRYQDDELAVITKGLDGGERWSWTAIPAGRRTRRRGHQRLRAGRSA